jgi:hypothetical protein
MNKLRGQINCIFLLQTVRNRILGNSILSHCVSRGWGIQVDNFRAESHGLTVETGFVLADNVGLPPKNYGK